MKRLLIALILVFCTTLVFAEDETEVELEYYTLKLGDNVKGWHTKYLVFTEDVFITEIEPFRIENKTEAAINGYRVVFSNGFVQYFYEQYTRNGLLGCISIFDNKDKEWCVHSFKSYNEIKFHRILSEKKSDSD